MKILTPWFLLLASALSAQNYQFVDSSKFVIEVGLRAGNLLGDITDQDGKYYSGIGFGLVDDKNNLVAMDPAGKLIGFEAGVLFRLSQDVWIGPAFSYQSVSESPTQKMKNDESADLLAAKIGMVKFRWEPIAIANSRYGLDAGVGMAFGSLRRYGLAAKNMDMIRTSLQTNAGVLNLTAQDIDNMVSYGIDGNRSLDVRGFHWNLSARGATRFSNGFGFDVELGFERTDWSVSGSDPLASRVTKYPSSISGFGLLFGIGASKAF